MAITMIFKEKDIWEPGNFIHYAGAVIDNKEVDAILDVIYSSNGRNWTIGEKGKQFEEELGRVSGCRNVVTTNSGSSALLLSILGLDLPKGSLIAIPATCFPTAYNAITYAGHIPVVVDSDIKTFNISLESLCNVIKNFNIAAVLVELIAGNIPDLDVILDICNVNNVKVILDNCDGFGGRYKEKPVESYADVAATSFHAAHIICTGEGGAVFTNDNMIAEKARQYRDWGREDGTDNTTNIPSLPRDYPKRYSYVVPGFNLKMLELQAAMGLVQLTKLNSFMKDRTDNFEFLKENLKDLPGIQLVEVVENAAPCWLSFPIYCNISRSDLTNFYTKKGIETRPIFAGNIVEQPYVKRSYQLEDLTGANLILKNGMFLPVSPRNSKEAYQYIVDCTKEYLCGI